MATGVRWLDLPDNADEPQALSVVRDGDGILYVRGELPEAEPWYQLSTEMPLRFAWGDLGRPLQIGGAVTAGLG